MKLIKFLMLICIGAFFIASNALGQANPSAGILPLNAGGVVAVGAVMDVKVTINNTGTATIVAAKLRPNVTIPALATILPDAQQTGLPAGWIIVSNAGGQIRVCNSSDPMPGGSQRDIIIKVQGLTIGGPTPCQVQINFGGATCAVSGPQPTGNNTVDDFAASSITVIAAPACAITASATTGSILCNGGTTILTAASAGTSNPVEYSIGGAFQTSPTFTVPAGTYTVTAREVATPTCIATATPVVISQPTVLSATTTSTPAGSPTATNGSATALAIGGTSPYTYLWASGGATTVTATGLAAGSYTVTVTDANGCTTTASATVAVAVCNLAVTATAGTILCNAGTTTLTATATGGAGLVEYSINGTTFQSGNTFTVPAGSYAVTAREASNTACTATSASVVIGQPTALVAAATTTAILCNGGNSTVVVSATGGTAPYTGTGTFIRTAGPYSYTVTDANGCTNTVSGTISQPAAVAVSATFAPIAVFNGTTTVNVTATGGTAPYTGTGAFVRADGTFTFNVTDANGCTGTTTITINPFAAAVLADPAVGQIFFTNTSNVLQSANTLLFPPVYKLKVPFYNLNQTNIVPNGTIQVRVNLGSKLILDPASTLATSPLSAFFAWTSAVVSDSVIITGTQIADIPADFDAVLEFNVKGKLSCTANVNARIIIVNTAALLQDQDLQNNNAILQYTLPVTLTTTQVNVTCNGLGNGIINAVASPGAVVVIRNSSNAIVGSTNLAPGTYTVTATAIGDAPLSNVCSSTTTVTIVQPLVLAATNNAGATVNNLCNGGNSGSLTVVASGGTAPYTYTIAGPTVNITGAATGMFTNLLAGSYIVTSTDANGCTAATAAIIITQPTGTAPDVSLGSDVSGTLFATTGTSRTIVYNVTEIAGNPAVGDTIRITNPSGFTINFNSALASATVGGTTYVLDNSRWKIDNSNPAFTSIILTDPSNPANPGTLFCNERKNVSVTLTRNTTNISTFTLSARFRRANGELNLNNNLNSIIFTAE